MAPLPRDVLVARLLRVFGARGGACSGRVKRFDEWPDQVRSDVLQAATNGDAPFLLYLAPTGDWTAVSLREVLSSASARWCGFR